MADNDEASGPEPYLGIAALDGDGLWADRPGAISTWTRHRPEPLNLQTQDVHIEDIAHALARQCRYLGHVHGHLSVARHSIWVSEHLEQTTGDEMLARWGLLHDAAETYLGDMPRPLKHLDEMKVFRDADDRATEVVAQRYGLPWPMPAVVLEADNYVLNERELRDARWTYEGNARRDEFDFLNRWFRLNSHAYTTLIGLHGPARVGKDTVGRIAIKHRGFERISFADPLRETLLAINPLVPVRRPAKIGFPAYTDHVRLSHVIADMGWEKAKDEIPEVRGLQQRTGTEAGREVLSPALFGDDRLWVDAAMSQVKLGGAYVFTDVRFENEAQAILDRGGEVWRIERPGFGPVNAHKSDAGLADEFITRSISNAGSERELKALVLDLIDNPGTPDERKVA